MHFYRRPLPISHEVFKKKNIEHHHLTLPEVGKSGNDTISHVATLFRDEDGTFSVIDQEGVVVLGTNNFDQALQKYASVWNFNGSTYDWHKIQSEDITNKDKINPEARKTQ